MKETNGKEEKSRGRVRATFVKIISVEFEKSCDDCSIPIQKKDEGKFGSMNGIYTNR